LILASKGTTDATSALNQSDAALVANADTPIDARVGNCAGWLSETNPH